MPESHDRPDAVDGPAHDPDAIALVNAYAQVVAEADGLPPVILVPHGDRWAGGLGKIVPRPRWFLRFFVVEHARRTLDAIRRHLLTQAARAPENDTDEVQRRSVSMYLDAVASHRRALFSTSLVLLTIVATRLLLTRVPGAIELFGGMQEQADTIRDLLTTIEAAIRNPTNPEMLVAKIAEWPLETTAFVLVNISTALYVVLRPLVPAFKVKRTLFNLYPDVGRVRAAPARCGSQRATGLYHLERSVLDRLGVRPVREPAWDLLVPALLLPAVLFLAVLMIDMGTRRALSPHEPLLSWTVGAALVLGAAARLAWLCRTWVRRRATVAGREDHTAPVPRAGLRDPRVIGVGTLVAAVFCWSIGVAMGTPPNSPSTVARFFFVLFVVAPLWFRMHWQLSVALGEPTGARIAWPVTLTVAMAPVAFGQTPPLLAVACALGAIAVTGVRLRRAEEHLDPEDRRGVHPALLPAGLAVPPLLLAHIQHVLNGIWEGDGTARAGAGAGTPVTSAVVGPP